MGLAEAKATHGRLIGVANQSEAYTKKMQEKPQNLRKLLGKAQKKARLGADKLNKAQYKTTEADKTANTVLT